jgi:nitrogen fixation protein FixH
MSRHFTGRDMLLMMVGFFGLVIGVNVTMAWVASSSFGGTVVENSYVASQEFNRWLAAARTQDKLSWQAAQSLSGDRHVVIAVSGDGAFTANGTALHPLGRAADVPLAFAVAADGSLRSTTALPPGRWQVRTTITRGDEVVRLAGPLR